MKNVLFVTFNEIGNMKYGGGQCTTRNYNMIKENCDSITTYKVSKSSNIGSLFSILEGNFPPLRLRHIEDIEQVINEQSINIVFIDNSSLGGVCKRIKAAFPNISIITFFHNIEFDYVKIRNSNNLKSNIYCRLVREAEQNAANNSDVLLCLTERDKKKVGLLYDRIPDDVIPITFSDQFGSNSEIDPYKKHPCGIMVGSCKPDTLEGVKWFCVNVAEQTNSHYYIIGNGFDRVKAELQSQNITVLGKVEDLTDYYYYSDFVCLPILSGAGMKVKTAEALMYGKYIFGSEEAFQGYDIEYDLAGGLCITADDYIQKINALLQSDKGRFNPYSRNCFVEYYSDNAARIAFSKYV